MAVTPADVRAILAESSPSPSATFEALAAIGRIGAFEDRNVARELVIRALDQRAVFPPDGRELLQALVREHGLFPYLNNVLELPLSDQIAYQAHRPRSWTFSDNLVFHSEQALVYERLLAGENVVLSAPTSFGKSLVIDAIIASKDFDNIAIVVPTIALMDETRRRLAKFANRYKIITHGSQRPGPKNLWVMTQERMLEAAIPDDLDFFVVDEFYKLDPGHGAERSSPLNILIWQLLATGAQFYMLGPNITALSGGVDERLRATFISTGYTTVATELERVRSTPEELPDDLAAQCREVGPGTLVFCRSPERTREVAGWLIDRGVGGGERLDGAADWVGQTYHPEWMVARALRAGIGIHHGRLPRALGHHIVRLFDEERMPYLLVTSTLIEGVNTAAKNVIILDNVIARKKYDYFTYANIRGRSGRMSRHFVGRVVVFNPEPRSADLTVDVPTLSQSPAAAPEVLIQLPDDQLTDQSRARLQLYYDQDVVSVDTLRSNKGLSLDRQLTAARTLDSSPRTWASALSWRGAYPTANQVRAIAPVLYELTGPGPAVRSPNQLGARVNMLRYQRGNLRALIDQQVASGRSTPDAAVEDTLEFARSWAQFKIPTALTALANLAGDVLGRNGLRTPDPSVFAGELENLFLPPYASVLEEYGLPSAVATKLQSELRLSAANSLDDVLDRLVMLRVEHERLGSFEREMLRDVQAGLAPRGS